MFTYEEIIKDWQKLGDATTLIEKSELSNKYNAKSNSKKVIETSIIAEMNNVRKNKENFTIKDVVWFNRNISSTDNYKKLSQLLSNENSSFVEFYKNYYYNKLVERKLININIKNMSVAEKYVYKTYLNINKFIEENSSEYKKTINEKEGCSRNVGRSGFVSSGIFIKGTGIRCHRSHNADMAGRGRI